MLGQPRRLLVSPEIVAVTWRAAQETSDTLLAEADVARALRRLDPPWDEPFPAELRRSSAAGADQRGTGTRDRRVRWGPAPRG